ncbi:hypothetical protein [Ruania rhizosphaerae]|uniref:hypothetical protein n=1 Tax=Ruania rhizosphaerae TaxID=1840413 RepID=UPI001359E57B|nr:hypothetical protein [Ruania rhizosphaerae]
MTTTFCAYPWDILDDPGVFDRVRRAGATGVAIAAAYHSVRAATPLHPGHMVIDAAESALYIDRAPHIWTGSTLLPQTDTPWTGSDAFGRAAELSRRAGLRVEAWVVLTHSTQVGRRHPDHAAVNAWGEMYPYALCPTSPAVRDYATRLIRSVRDRFAVDGLMIEACGPMGLGHVGRHEKTAGADWTETAQNLLSICFCGWCQAAYQRAGIDTERVRADVVNGVRAEAEGKHGEVESHVREAQGVLAVRTHSRRELLRNVLASCAGVERTVFHADPEPWSTGPFAALFDDADDMHGIVVPAHRLADGGAHDLRARLNGSRLGGYLMGLPPMEPASIRTQWPALIEGLDDVYLYHLGLLSQPRLDAVGHAVTTAGHGRRASTATF